MNDAKSGEASLSEDKSPGQLNFEGYARRDPSDWIFLRDSVKASWELAANAVRAPLLAEIERLKQFARKCDWCKINPAVKIEHRNVGTLYSCEECDKKVESLSKPEPLNFCSVCSSIAGEPINHAGAECRPLTIQDVFGEDKSDS